MKKLLFSLLLFSPALVSTQCFTGLDSIYCDNYLPDTLTPFYPGGYFDGDGVSAEGVFFPSFPGIGTHVITYANTNYYEVDTTGIYNPVEGSGTEVNLIDDGFSDGIDLGFNFEFFGSTKSYFRIHSNGFITFNFEPAIFPPYANDIPTPGMPTDFIAASWGDYDPTEGGTIEYFSAGTAPYRKMIINYIDVPPYGGDIGNLTTQVILYETTNIIEIHTTASPDYGNEKSMGIENIDGTVGFVRPGRNNSIWEAFNDYVAFIPVFCTDTTEILDGTPITIAEDTISLCENASGTVHVSGVDSYTWLPPYDDLFSESGTPGEFIVDASLPPGIYTCIVIGTAVNGCTANDTCILKVNDCTNAVSDIPGDISFTVYPNPAMQRISIELNDGLNNQSYQMNIRDFTGKLVAVSPLTPGVNTESIELLPAGFYMLEVKCESGSGCIPLVKTK